LCICKPRNVSLTCKFTKNDNIDRYSSVFGVIVGVLDSIAVDRGYVPRSGLSKDYKSCSCGLSTMHTALRRKSKYWLHRNQDNVSTCILLLQCNSTIKINIMVFV
jgi:hypothetical protein